MIWLIILIVWGIGVVLVLCFGKAAAWGDRARASERKAGRKSRR